MVTPPEPDCWLHPDVVVGQSTIEGRGLFTRRAIAAGATVGRVGGRLVSTDELDQLFAAAARDPARPYIDTIVVGDDVHLVLPPRRPIGYGNHSCDPNVWWVDAYTLAARRDIGVGEEVTNDYGTSTAADDFRMDCECRA